MRKSLLSSALPLVGACLACEVESAVGPRPGPADHPPLPVANVPGIYRAVLFEARRGDSVLDLLSLPGSRLVIELREDGTTTGQLKITGDTQLRTKNTLYGTYRLLGRRVRFTFTSKNFLEEVEFRLEADTLEGTWRGPDVEVVMILQRGV